MTFVGAVVSDQKVDGFACSIHTVVGDVAIFAVGVVAVVVVVGGAALAADGVGLMRILEVVVVEV